MERASRNTGQETGIEKEHDKDILDSSISKTSYHLHLLQMRFGFDQRLEVAETSSTPIPVNHRHTVESVDMKFSVTSGASKKEERRERENVCPPQGIRDPRERMKPDLHVIFSTPASGEISLSMHAISCYY